MAKPSADERFRSRILWGEGDYRITDGPTPRGDLPSADELVRQLPETTPRKGKR